MNAIPPHYVKVGDEWFSPSDKRVKAQLKAFKTIVDNFTPPGYTVAKPAKRLRPVSPEERLNKTEREFLSRLRSGVYGKFEWIGIQCLTVQLGFDCRYTPDFATRMVGGDFRLWETKGKQIWEDSLIKIRTAARMYPFWTFVLAQKKNAEWTEKIINQ